MTLLLGSVDLNEIIVVGDRRGTDASTGKTVTEKAYKLFTYFNPWQDYHCIVGIAGLATLGRSATTIDWLMRAMPRAMGPEQSYRSGIIRLAEECTDRWSKIKTPDPTWKRTVILLCGRGGVSRGWPNFVPFVTLISNSMEPNGAQALRVSREFNYAIKLPASNGSRDLKRFGHRICRGDLRAVSNHMREWNDLVRYLRRPIPHQAKVKLMVRFTRIIAGDRGSRGTVGRDLLSMTFPREGISLGGDWHEDSSDPTLTMPHFVTADGGIMTDFSVTPLTQT